MRWPKTEGRIPEHPYRDSAILYAVLSGLIVATSALTGRGAARGIVIALAFFVVATGWTWWRFHQRLERQRR